MREAMVNSRNLVSIRLLRDIGVSYAREYISGFGFDPADLPANLSMALGSANLPPISMARGYAAFANGGYLVDPYFISSITNDDGDVIYQANPAVVCADCDLDSGIAPEQEVVERDEPEFRPLAIANADEKTEIVIAGQQDENNEKQSKALAPSVITPQNAYLVRSMMMDVVKRGTGVKAMQLGRQDLAGKTGTTNEQRDAWFSGYNDALVTTVWVGFDSHEPLGSLEVGGRAALPIWIGFMKAALDGVPDQPPAMPEGLAQARIDPESGFLATPDNPDAIMEVFQAGRLPRMDDNAATEDSDFPEEEDPYDF